MKLETYRGYDIDVNLEGRFVVTLDKVEGTSKFDTAAAAREAIDTLKRAETGGDLAIELPIINGAGELRKITGINRQTGFLNGVGADGRAYPDVDWIIVAIKQAVEHEKEAKRLRDRLQPHMVHAPMGSGGYARSRITTAAEYEKRIATLKAEYAAVRERAETGEKQA